jgi:molybdopterin/thiamine biosynthesis adenylyltransferase
VIGSLQALEALKLLGGLPPLLDGFLQVDLANYEVIRVGVARRPGCPDCGAD